MHDLRIKLNPASPRQKQYYIRRLFDQEIEVKFKEETSKVLISNHSFVYCQKFNSSESRSELLRAFWNVVMQKDRGDQLADRLKNEDILQRMADNKNILHTIKRKKPNWTRQQFTTLNQQNSQKFP